MRPPGSQSKRPGACGFTATRARPSNPATTYARYGKEDGGPGSSMPMRNARTIAGALGCFTGAIVGREWLDGDEAERRAIIEHAARIAHGLVATGEDGQPT